MTTAWADTSWMASSEKKCVREPASTFFAEDADGEESPYPSPRAKELCGQCPFRPECLRYAQDNDIEYGTWGGMSAFQRGQLGRKITRKKCPNCTSSDVIIENSHELCLACGTSWDIF